MCVCMCPCVKPFLSQKNDAGFIYFKRKRKKRKEGESKRKGKGRRKEVCFQLVFSLFFFSSLYLFYLFPLSLLL